MDIIASEPAAVPVEPETARPPKGFGWVSRVNVTNIVTEEEIAISILAGLPDGMLEQVPITDGLTVERLKPRSKYRQR